MNLEKDLIDVAPLLLPVDSQGLCYAGFITSGSQSFYMKITLKEVDKAKGAWIETDWKLKYLLRGYKDIVTKRQEQSHNLTSFIIELKSILDQIVHTSPALFNAPPPTFYMTILEDIETIGWNRIAHLDQDFRDIKISSKDKAGREHVLSIHLSDKHPQVAPICNTLLPIPFEFKWSPSTSSLCSVLKEFDEEVKMYQTFWNLLDEIDSKTWVIEPKDPSTSHSCVYRRLMLDPEVNLSIHLTFDPLKPADLPPECRFIGPDHATGPLNERLSDLGHEWNNSIPVLSNLQNVLRMKLPSPLVQQKQDFTIECGICYTEQGLTDSLPDINCPNQQCARPFHHSCLHEWFSGLPDARSKTFNTVKGECPYCCTYRGQSVVKNRGRIYHYVFEGDSIDRFLLTYGKN